jgi:hypothetical protein
MYTYTDASFQNDLPDLLGNEMNSAGTHELVHHIRGETAPTIALVPLPSAQLKIRSFGISGSSW